MNCSLLGVDRVLAYVLSEWLLDIRKNQLPSLLGGVGPMYSLVQLGISTHLTSTSISINVFSWL